MNSCVLIRPHGYSKIITLKEQNHRYLLLLLLLLLNNNVGDDVIHFGR